MAGEKITADKQDRLQKLMEIIRFNHQATAFLEAYMRFQVIVGDVYKILGEAIEEGMGDFGKN